MVGGALERRDEGASNALGFIKKYPKLRKCEPIYYRNVDFKRVIFLNGDRIVITLFDNAFWICVRSARRTGIHKVGFGISHAYCFIATEQLR